MVFTLSSLEVSAQLNAFSVNEAASDSNIRKPSIARIRITKSSESKLTDLIATSGRCATMTSLSFNENCPSSFGTENGNQGPN